MSWNRFTLLQLFALVTLAGVAALAIRVLGLWVILAGLLGLTVLVLLVVAWSAAYTCAPKLVKYATVLGFIGVVMLSLLSCWIARARDEARRNTSIHQLRLLGRESQHRGQFQSK